MKERVYIHYNSDTYDKDRLRRAMVNKHKNSRYDKPKGLWASPENSKWDWKSWCEGEEFHVEKLDKSFRFTLSPNAKVLRLNKIEEADRYITWIDNRHIELNLPLIYNNFDAMEVSYSSDYRFGSVWFDDSREVINLFNSWDVDSICIWNPSVIMPV